MGARLHDLVRALRKRLRAVLRPATADQEMRDEIHFHLEMEARKLEAAGLPSAEAARRARVAFGGVEGVKEEVRADRGFRWLVEAGRDLRFAVRAIGRAPAVTAVAVLTLALGIGAATSIFALVDATLLRQLPYRDPGRLVHIWETNPEGGDFSVAESNYLDFRDRNTTLASLAAYRPEQFALTGRGEPQALTGAAATASLWTTLGVNAILGRTFTAEEDQPNAAAPVVLLSHDLWQRSFGADSAVVGATALLRGEPYTIIGVLPADFRLLDADAWIPLGADPDHDRGDHWLGMIGRMRPAVAAAEVSADLQRITAANAERFPVLEGWGARTASLSEFTIGADLQRTSKLLGAAVAVLLLLACANVANLLLARASARDTELAVRIAMGAGRGRLVRQLLVESGVLACLGTAVGLLGVWGVVVMARRLPPDTIPGIRDLVINGRLLGFSLAATIVTTLAAGLVPALGGSRVDLHSTLKRAGRTGGERHHHRLQELLVAGQVALAILLLVGGGLMIRSVVRLGRAETGLAMEHVWSVPLSLPRIRYPEEWQVARFYNVVAARIEAIPGVVAAGATAVEPFSGNNMVNDVTPESLAAEYSASGYAQAMWRVVSPGYFTAAGIPLLQGRPFDDDDRFDGEPIAIVTRSLAERLWPGESAIGKRLFWGGTEGAPRTVVGVVGDVSDVEVGQRQPAVMFLTTRQFAWPGMTLVIRADREVPGIATLVRQAIWEEDPELPVPAVNRLAEERDRAIATPRLGAWTLGLFGAAALGLALVGLYGVMSYAVVERTREIGIRMALGARPRTVVASLVGRALGLTAFGIVAGLAASIALAPLIRSLLYLTDPMDPLVLVAVPVALLVVAAVAAFLPARWATRIDPASAFRAE